MSDDIELGLLDNSSSRSSSNTTLYDRRVHPGYGARRLPLKTSSGIVGAGQNYQPVFENQLGIAAATSDPFGINKQRKQDLETQSIYDQEASQGNILRASEIKPQSINWNKVTRKQYPAHWKGVKAWKEKHLPAKQGLTLPFSKNIGPGNTVQQPLTRSDAIAASHDIHYEDAKSSSDVLSADKEAISHFAYETVNPEHPISQIQASIGLLGLGAKHTAESLSGKVFYGNYVSSVS